MGLERISSADRLGKRLQELQSNNIQAEARVDTAIDRVRMIQIKGIDAEALDEGIITTTIDATRVMMDSVWVGALLEVGVSAGLILKIWDAKDRAAIIAEAAMAEAARE